MKIPYFGFDCNGPCWLFNGGPIHLSGHELTSKNLTPRPNDDRIPVRIDHQHIERLSGRNTQSPALPNGVMNNAAVPTQDVTLPISDGPRSSPLRHMLLKEPAVIVIRNEANLLALRLACYRQLQIPGNLSHPLLGEISHRHQGMFQLTLGHGVEGV